jgi:HAD superfamily hydrolase (TIGR01509 family)
VIKGIIFDLDGVLVDAGPWHYECLNRALAHFGYSICENEHRNIYNGLPTRLKLDLLSDREGFPRALHSFVNELKQFYVSEEIEKRCQPIPAITEMLRGLKAQGFLLAVASNSIRSTVDTVLRKMEISQFFDLTLSNQDVDQPKPSAEIYRKCQEKLGIHPDECLIVEDSFPGICAARQASPHVAIVAHPNELTASFLKRYLDRESKNTLETLENGTNEQVIEILIPMAGRGERFSKVGYTKPKPLIDVLGKSMVEWVIENITPKTYRAHFNFICNQEHVEKYDIEKHLKALVPNCSIFVVPNYTEGAACTALFAAERLQSHRPLLIANSDQYLNCNIDDFLNFAFETKADGLIMTFEASDKKWSYARVNEKGFVTEVAEKNPISRNATTGIYFFKRCLDFFDATKRMIKGNIRTNNEFYICPVFNELVKQKKEVRLFDIGASQMHGLGTPEDLKVFLDWKTAA